MVVIRKSKTNQVGAGRKIGIPFGSHEETCPVRAVLAWIEEAEIEDGPLFRSVNKHEHVMETRLSDKACQRALKTSQSWALENQPL